MGALRSRTIIDAARKYGKPGTAGGNTHLVRQVGRSDMHGNAGPAQRAFARDIAAAPVTELDSYAHPGVRQPGEPALAGMSKGPLTQSEELWLNQLSGDPGALTHTEARTVLAMESRHLPPDQARWLATIAGPLRAHHDRAAAGAVLKNAMQPNAPLPASTIPALAEALVNETPGLSPGDAIAHASEVLNGVTAQRDTERAAAINDAQAAVDRLR